MPFLKLWIHFVWSTKKREKIITKKLKPLLLDHIKTNAREKKIFIDTINCVEDHIHILVSLGTDQTVSKIVQLIKGESSHWANKEKIINGKFEWQDEYYAATVDDSAVEIVRSYIQNQEEHHHKRTFDEEYQTFIKGYSFPINQ